jgi:hypothetical protein
MQARCAPVITMGFLNPARSSERAEAVYAIVSVPALHSTAQPGYLMLNAHCRTQTGIYLRPRQASKEPTLGGLIPSARRSSRQA